MARQFYLILMLFCLGIMVFPNQNFNVEIAQMSCCAETSSSDHCDNISEKKECNHDKKESGSDKCNDACSTCHTCTGFFGSFVINATPTDFQKNISDNKKVFGYNFPAFINQNSNIWQPPKVA